MGDRSESKPAADDQRTRLFVGGLSVLNVAIVLSYNPVCSTKSSKNYNVDWAMNETLVWGVVDDELDCLLDELDVIA